MTFPDLLLLAVWPHTAVAGCLYAAGGWAVRAWGRRRAVREAAAWGVHPSRGGLDLTDDTLERVVTAWAEEANR